MNSLKKKSQYTQNKHKQIKKPRACEIIQTSRMGFIFTQVLVN